MSLKKFDYGLAIMRLQPFHFGHAQLIDRMQEECNHPIVAIGSSQESRTYGNPFTFTERKRMVQSYYGTKCPMLLPLKDIFNITQWARYALDSIEKQIHNKVSVYYCGNDQDGALFMKEGLKLAINDRDIGIYKGLSASKIRQWILTGTDEWEKFVPSMNHALVKKIYRSERPKI